MSKTFLFICLLATRILSGEIALAGGSSDPACPVNPAFADIAQTCSEVNNSIYDHPPGFVNQYLEATCAVFYSKSTRPTSPYQLCIHDPTMKALQSTKSKGDCLKYVRDVLDKLYPSMCEFGSSVNGAARNAGANLLARGFVKDPAPLTLPGPPVGDQLEVRVYDGGNTFKCPRGGKVACGHVEICFLGKCTSDYSRFFPIDEEEHVITEVYQNEHVRHETAPHILTGIYRMGPTGPLSCPNLNINCPATGHKDFECPIKFPPPKKSK